MQAREELESAPSILELFSSAKKLLRLQTRVENRQLRKENFRTQRSHTDLKSMNSVDLLSPVSIDDLKNGGNNANNGNSAINMNHNGISGNTNGNRLTKTTTNSSSTTTTTTASNNNNNTNNNGNVNSSGNAKSYVTPSSMNDSPPGSNSSHNSRNNSDTPNTSMSWGSQQQPLQKQPPLQQFTPGDKRNTIDENNEYVDDSSNIHSSVRIKDEPTTDISSIDIHSNQLDGFSNGGSKSSISSNSAPGVMAKKSNLTASIHSQQRNMSPTPGRSPPGFDNGSVSSTRSNSVTSSSNAAGPTECFNCHTLKTPLWRKDPVGNTLCNACGLFQKLHGTTRPLSLKTDVIKKRNSRRLPSNSKATSTSVGNTPNAYPFSISRKNSYQDMSSSSLPNRNPNFYSNGIPISSSPSSNLQNNVIGNNTNILTNSPAVGTGRSTSIGGGSSMGNASMGSRYKNVLILPKPQGTGAAATPSTSQNQNFQQIQPASASSQHQQQQQQSRSNNMKSIPIPAGNDFANEQSYSVSPFTNGTASDNNKRKRTDLELGITSNNTMESSSFSKRTPSQVSLSSYGKRGSTSSFQSSSLNRRTSVTSFSTLQRKNSVLGNMNMSTPPTNALTPTNIGLLNQRFAAQTGSYFDNNGGDGIVSGTPGSERSSYGGFGIANNFATNFNEDLYEQIKGNNMGGRGTVGVDGGNDIETDDFFKNYTSLHNDIDVGGEFVTPGTKFEINIPQSNQVSSLTTGLKQSEHSIGSGSTSKNTFNSTSNFNSTDNGIMSKNSEDVKDLDWLKFEI